MYVMVILFSVHINTYHSPIFLFVVHISIVHDKSLCFLSDTALGIFRTIGAVPLSLSIMKCICDKLYVIEFVTILFLLAAILAVHYKMHSN